MHDGTESAISFSKDSDAKDLAKGYGAVTLLDKMSLYGDMIPAILECGHRPAQHDALPRKKTDGATSC